MVLAAEAIRWNSDLAVTKKQDLDSNGGFQTSITLLFTTRSERWRPPSQSLLFCRYVSTWHRMGTEDSGNKRQWKLFQCPALSENFIVTGTRHRLEHFAALSVSRYKCSCLSRTFQVRSESFH
jgi:hypothetical protein